MIKTLFKSFFKNFVTMRTTSISDNRSYSDVCKRAASDLNLFNNFRCNKDYTNILEHVSESLGQAYLELICKDNQISKAIPEFKLNDLYGNPQMFDFNSFGIVSPTTLRYIKVLTDLKAHFQSLDGMKICEIGVGYGGQCRIVNAFYQPMVYCLVDLKPALNLAKRFLSNFKIEAELSFKAMKELDNTAYDLVISNYAFSELTRSLQKEYLSKVILKSSRGYITYNEITPVEFNSYKADELIAMIPGARRISEIPLTHSKNCIIVWGGN